MCVSPKERKVLQIHILCSFFKFLQKYNLKISFSYQVIKDVFLMDMHCNEGLVFSSLNFGELSGCHGNELVQNVQELLIGVLHNFLVHSSIVQSLLGISGPQHLETQQTDLGWEHVLELNEFEAGISDANGCGSGDTVERLPGDTEQVSQPDLHITLSHDWFLQRDVFSLLGVESKNLVVHLLVEAHSLGVVKHAQQVGLDGVRVAGLTQNLQQGGVRHEEESGEDQTLLLQVSSQRLLTDLQLFQEMRQELTQSVVSHAALHHVRNLMGPLHDLHPGLVNVAEALGFLRQLFGNVTAHKYRLQVDPQVLHHKPVFNDLSGAGQFLDPLLDFRFEWSIVSVAEERSQHHQAVFHQRHCLRGGVTFQQKLTPGLEASELEVLGTPIIDHLLQLGFNVLLFHGRDTHILNVLFIL